MAITFQSGLTFAGNTQEDKPSSLLALIISDEGKNIYNIDTRSDALPDLCRHISENKMNFTFCIFTVYKNVIVSTFLFFLFNTIKLTFRKSSPSGPEVSLGIFLSRGSIVPGSGMERPQKNSFDLKIWKSTIMKMNRIVLIYFIHFIFPNWRDANPLANPPSLNKILLEI
jgi:hypothetical protein